jgi:hypothetical protein
MLLKSRRVPALHIRLIIMENSSGAVGVEVMKKMKQSQFSKAIVNIK